MGKKRKPKRRRWHAVADRVSSGAVGAEIGVYEGKMSSRLMRMVPGLKLYMVDRWKPYSRAERRGSPKTRMAKIRDKAKWKAIRLKAKAVAKKYKGAKILKGDSVKMSERIPDASLDFVFIDGDHRYEGVRRDILAWMPKVKPGGWLMGHDYGNKPDKGVRKAVDELGVEVEIDKDHVWAIRLPSPDIEFETEEQDGVTPLPEL